MIVAASPPIRASSTGRASRAIAKSVGAYFFVDMAHVAGLVAAGHLPESAAARRCGDHDDAQDAARPARRSDPGARQRRDHQEAQLDGVPRHAGRPADARHRRQGGGVAGGAAAGVQATTSARCWPTRAPWRARLAKRGYKIVSGGTDNHLFLLSLADRNITGKDADAALGRANITVNKNAVPNDPRPPMVTSGLRIGTPASTTRGFKEPEIEQVADFIADVLDAEGAAAAIERVRPQVLELCRRFPVYGAVSGARRTRRMHCPFCGHDETKVTDSRLAGEGRQIRRRRECLSCGERFTTFETAELVMPRGRQGRPQPRAVR